MSDYSRNYDFSVKDALSTGDPNKLIKGSEVDEEFDDLVTVTSTKANKAVPSATNNVATLSSTGDLQDSGLLVPAQFGTTSAEQAALAIAVPSDTSEVTQTSVQITNMVKMTQTAYDAETPNASTLYIIVG